MRTSLPMARLGVGIALLASLAVAWPRQAPSALAPPEPLRRSVGPVARAPGASATLVTTAAELRRLIAQPDGPREIELRGGVYRGDLRIRRPMTLRGDGGVILEGSGRDNVIAIESDDVTLENLAVRHSGRRQTDEDAAIRVKGARARISAVAVSDSLFGISIGPCPSCTIERCRVSGPAGNEELRGDGIKLWEASDSVVRDNVVEDVRDVVVWYSRRVHLEGNTVRRSRYGTHFMYAHDSIVRNSRIEHNTVGIFVMYSSHLQVEHNVLGGARGAAGMGIGFKESDDAVLRGNWLVANTTGLYLDRTPLSASKPVVFSGNVIALNDVAMGFLGSEEGLTFEHNDFRANTSLVSYDTEGRQLAARFSHNRWSEYAGYDLDGDGVGDVPFQVKQLSRELMDATPSLGLFQGTAAFELIDAIAHAVPVLSSRVLLSDSTPELVARRPK